MLFRSVTERVKRLAGNKIEQGIGIPTIESRASIVPMDKDPILSLAQRSCSSYAKAFLMSSIISLDHEIVQLPDTVGMVWVYQTS